MGLYPAISCFSSPAPPPGRRRRRGAWKRETVRCSTVQLTGRREEVPHCTRKKKLNCGTYYYSKHIFLQPLPKVMMCCLTRVSLALLLWWLRCTTVWAAAEEGGGGEIRAPAQGVRDYYGFWYGDRGGEAGAGAPMAADQQQYQRLGGGGVYGAPLQGVGFGSVVDGDPSLVTYITAMVVSFAFTFVLVSNLLSGLKARNQLGQQKQEEEVKAISILASMEELRNVFEGAANETATIVDEVTTSASIAANTTSVPDDPDVDPSSPADPARLHGLLQRVLRKETSLPSMPKEDRKRLVEALVQQRRRLTGLKDKEEEDEKEKRTDTTSTEEPVKEVLRSEEQVSSGR